MVTSRLQDYSSLNWVTWQKIVYVRSVASRLTTVSGYTVYFYFPTSTSWAIVLHEDEKMYTFLHPIWFIRNLFTSTFNSLYMANSCILLFYIMTERGISIPLTIFVSIITMFITTFWTSFKRVEEGSKSNNFIICSKYGLRHFEPKITIFVQFHPSQSTLS